MSPEIVVEFEAPPPVRDEGFACSCPDFPKDAAGKSVRTESDGERECAAVYEWAMRFMSNKYHTVTPEDFLTAAVMTLHHGYEATIDDIGADMWFGLAVSTYPRARAQFSYYLACDRLEHGLAFTLRAFALHFGEKNTAGMLDDDEWKAKQRGEPAPTPEPAP